MSRHVVFGTGQVGRHVLAQLVAAGEQPVGVNRRGRSSVAGAAVIAGDATDPDFTTRVCRGAEVVYFCLNASHYDRWDAEFPPLQRGVLAGAASAGARLVVLDNLYSYAPSASGRLDESSPVRPSSTKAAVRAAMTDELLEAHRAGRVEVVIGRASDYYGPGTTRSALGAEIFQAARRGRPCRVLGDPDQPHSYSYTPDVAAGLIILGSADGTTGEIWHQPVGPTRSTRQIIEQIYALAGQRARIRSVGALTLRLVGVVQPAVRDYRQTLHQFSGPWVVSDAKFSRAFGEIATPLADGLATTWRWFENHSQPEPPPQLRGDDPRSGVSA